MQQFKTINKNGLIQTWTLADYNYNQVDFFKDYDQYRKDGMIYLDSEKLKLRKAIIDKVNQHYNDIFIEYNHKSDTVKISDIYQDDYCDLTFSEWLEEYNNLIVRVL